MNGKRAIHIASLILFSACLTVMANASELDVQSNSDTLSMQFPQPQITNPSRLNIAQADQANDIANKELVDLSDDQQDSTGSESNHVLANPWYQNIEISGFGAAGYYGTGSAGTKPEGGFEIKEASLFIDAEVWEDVSFYIELQTNRLGDDKTKFTRTGEVYVLFNNLIPSIENGMALKVGRIDIPFGEEYLWHDAIDNPLISNSVSYPYGWDEGKILCCLRIRVILF